LQFIHIYIYICVGGGGGGRVRVCSAIILLQRLHILIDSLLRLSSTHSCEWTVKHGSVVLGSFSFFWHCIPWWTRASSFLEATQQKNIFMGWGCQTHAQPPTWKTRISLFVWVITFDLSDRGDPTSSYATTTMALRII
jgi:hypothetical protein